jgi:thiol-disulfide isomerase/thioredoxin
MSDHANARGRRFRCGALLVVASALSIAACDKEGGRAASPEEEGKNPLLGAQAPDFDLPAQSGGARASLAGGADKVVLVDFWATWCEPCRVSFPHYQSLAKKYDGDLIVVGISEDDDPSGIQAFAKETGATFALAWDANKSVAAGYHPDSMPTSFLIDKNKLVRYVHGGFRPGDEKIIEEKVKALLK